MGIAYLHLGNYALARAALQEASKRDEKKSEEIQRVLDWIEARIGQGAGTQAPQSPPVE